MEALENVPVIVRVIAGIAVLLVGFMPAVFLFEFLVAAIKSANPFYTETARNILRANARFGGGEETIEQEMGHMTPRQIRKRASGYEQWHPRNLFRNMRRANRWNRSFQREYSSIFSNWWRR